MISQAAIAYITGALALLVLILLPIDHVLSKRKVRRQKLFDRRMSKKKRNERVAAFNLIAIKHAQNMSRPPLVLMQAADRSLNPAHQVRFSPLHETAEQQTAEDMEVQRAMHADREYDTIPEESDTNGEASKENGEPGGFVTHKYKVSPPETILSNKRKKKSKVTPQSEQGGIVNAAFHDSFPSLNDQSSDSSESTHRPSQKVEHQHVADVHNGDICQPKPIIGTLYQPHHSTPLFHLPNPKEQHDNIALQIGYNELGKLATDV